MFASEIIQPLARRTFLRAGATSMLLATSGCNSFIPSSGPRSGGIMGPATQQAGDPGSASAPSLRYALLTLDTPIVASLDADKPSSLFSAGLQSRGAAEVRLGTGDILTITVFETQSGGLFIPVDSGARPGNFVTLPQQQVGRDGMISIPFAGSVRAAGHTAGELERTIAGRLRQRALEPQVIVTLVERRSAAVSVVGDVDQSLRFTLDPGGERILGAIARAGAPGTRRTRHW